MGQSDNTETLESLLAEINKVIAPMNEMGNRVLAIYAGTTVYDKLQPALVNGLLPDGGTGIAVRLNTTLDPDSYMATNWSK